MRHTDDNAGKHKIYEEVLEKVNALQAGGDGSVRVHQQKAQCFNMLMRTLPESSSPAQKYELIDKAATLALEQAHNGFDQFLVRLFLQNRASFAFNCLDKGTPIDGISIEKIDQWHDQVQEMCAQQGYNHFYDAIFCLNAAKAAHYARNVEKAKDLLQKALEVCHKHASSTAEIREDIEAFATQHAFYP